jgi:hypothetical protein
MNTKSAGSLIIARILKSDFQEDGMLQYDRFSHSKDGKFERTGLKQIKY